MTGCGISLNGVCTVTVRALSLRSGVIYGFCDRALTLTLCPVFKWACGFECARAMRFLVCEPCFMLEHGVRTPALEFWLRVGVRTLAFRLVVWVCGLEFARDALLFTCVFLVLHVWCCFYRLHAFKLCFVLCGTQLVFFIGCVLSCCHVLCEHVAYEYSLLLRVRVLFCTWLVIYILLAMCLCFVCVSTWLLS